MELKQYQKKVMHNISDYMDCLAQEKSLLDAWNRYWIKQDISVGFGGVPPYNDTIPDVPHICIKVPTGGGKTFMACTAIKRIFDKMPTNNSKVVVWLVPSDSILSQTINALSDIYHPYRQQLNNDFCGRVGVYSKDQLLNGENFSPDTVREMLTVCVMSYGSLRIDSTKKDVRKVYQENGNLLRFADYLNDKELLMADTPETALIQVLRQLSPITIVDESHNAGSDLSVEMLKNLNPLLVLDLTATPRKKSNIISYVDARELKKENMVKLPVIVYNALLAKVLLKTLYNFGRVLRCRQPKKSQREELIFDLLFFFKLNRTETTIAILLRN
jgi:type III restriction enzyme